MIRPDRLYNFLKQQGVDFFTGVPDSLLKHFLKYIQDNAGEGKHIITANEGLAIGLATGYHLSTGKLPLVYLQNSGLGNTINPLTSLADKEMYAIPVLLMIGWRGRPGTGDEPQHLKSGRITIPLLEVLDIPCFILDEKEEISFDMISQASKLAIKEQKPVAVLVPQDIFEIYEGIAEPDNYSLQREEVIKKIVAGLNGDETVVCTTGKIGREFLEQNNLAGKKIKKYLLSVGAMGHASHIALGISMNTNGKIITLDGDGALLMHLGALPAIAHYAGKGFIHLVINNGCHESVGGQPTEAFFADCCGIAAACGYSKTICISNTAELDQWLENGLGSGDTQFVEIRTSRNSRDELGRPAGKPAGWKKEFMDALNQSNK